MFYIFDVFACDQNRSLSVETFPFDYTFPIVNFLCIHFHLFVHFRFGSRQLLWFVYAVLMIQYMCMRVFFIFNNPLFQLFVYNLKKENNQIIMRFIHKSKELYEACKKMSK